MLSRGLAAGHQQPVSGRLPRDGETVLPHGGRGRQAPPADRVPRPTPDEVTAILGQPKRVVNLGAKEICAYADMKIIFVNGKVSDVE
jgi:hypothetical protein